MESNQNLLPSQKKTNSFSLSSSVNNSNLGLFKEYATHISWHDPYPYQRTTQYVYWPTTTSYLESKFDTAFKIVAKLIENGTVKEMSVKKFIALVKEVADEL